MATAEQVSIVRRRTDEPTQDNFSDEEVNSLVDQEGMDGATIEILRARVARFSRLVNVSEAGASRQMSQAYDQAKKLLEAWERSVATEGGHNARVHKIERPEPTDV